MKSAFFTQSVLWRNTRALGTDYCTLYEHPLGYDLKGTVLTVSKALPYLIHYEVRCDKANRTKEVSVRLQSGETQVQLHLGICDGRWWRNGREVSALRGCADVDLGVTPATNTLPIRRLNLGVGESREVQAAWVKFPSLETEPLAQRYTRLSEHRYRYESERVEVDLEVDSAGFVTHYPDGWVLEAQRDDVGQFGG